MSSTGVLDALTHVTGARLRFVCLVEAPALVDPLRALLQAKFDAEDDLATKRDLRAMVRTTEARMCYLAFGSTNMYFLDRAMRGNDGYGLFIPIPYTGLEQVVEDEGHAQRLRFDFNSSAPSECPSQLEVMAAGRATIVGELTVSWRTAHMVSSLVLEDMPIKRLHLRNLGTGAARGVGDIRAFVVEPTGERKHTYKGYFFFAPSNFKPYPPQAKMVTGQFASNPKRPDKQSFFEISVHDPTSVYTLTERGIGDIKILAEQRAAEISSRVESVRTIGTPKRYYKKMNITGDTAAWDGWIIKIRTLDTGLDSELAKIAAMRDICIIALRRKYIPPMMDMCQDILVTYYGHTAKWHAEDAHFEKYCEGIADSVSAIARVSRPDDMVVQARADSLRVDETALTWYRARLRIEPRSVQFAQRFIKSVLAMLGSSGLRYNPTQVFRHLDAEITLQRGTNPFEFARMLERDDLGMPDTAAPDLREGWRRRVWAYLAWCIDGGLAPGILRMGDLVQAVSMLTGKKETRKRLTRLIDTLLYMHPRGRAFTWAPMEQMASDDRMMRDFDFNVSIMCALLDSNYVEQELSGKMDSGMYPKFLLRLLSRQQHGARIPKLQYAVCRELVKMSLRDRGFSGGGAAVKAMELVKYEMVVPALVSLLRSTDENVQILATVALVNYSNSNAALKGVIMQTSAARHAVRFLRSSNMDLVRHASALLNNLTGKGSEHFRKNVASYGAIPPLMRLLQHSPIPPQYCPIPVLIQTVSVIGNLAANSDLRDEVTSALGFSSRMDKRLRTSTSRESISIVTIVHLLAEPQFRTEATRNILLERIVFTLRNLALKHNANKELVGQLAMRQLVDLVQAATSDDLIISVLQCIYILSYNKENCRILERERFSVVLDRYIRGNYSMKIRDLSKQIEKRYALVGEAA